MCFFCSWQLSGSKSWFPINYSYFSVFCWAVITQSQLCCMQWCSKTSVFIQALKMNNVHVTHGDVSTDVWTTLYFFSTCQIQSGVISLKLTLSHFKIFIYPEKISFMLILLQSLHLGAAQYINRPLLLATGSWIGAIWEHSVVYQKAWMYWYVWHIALQEDNAAL